MTVPTGKEGVNLEDGVQDADEPDQDGEAAGEEVHEKQPGFFQAIGADQHFHTENKQKNRKNTDNHNFNPPEP